MGIQRSGKATECLGTITCENKFFASIQSLALQKIIVLLVVGRSSEKNICISPMDDLHCQTLPCPYPGLGRRQIQRDREQTWKLPYFAPFFAEKIVMKTSSKQNIYVRMTGLFRHGKQPAT